MPKKNKATDHLRPEDSPYTSPIITLCVGPTAVEFFVHRDMLRKSSVWASLRDWYSWTQRIDAPDLSEVEGHAVIHYLYTGEYQIHVDPSNGPQSEALQYKQSVQVYWSAFRYGLEGLQTRAKYRIRYFESFISTGECLDVIRSVYPDNSSNDAWFGGHVQRLVTTLLEKDLTPKTKEELISSTGKNANFDKIVMQTLFEMYEKSCEVVSMRSGTEQSNSDAPLITHRGAEHIEKEIRNGILRRVSFAEPDEVAEANVDDQPSPDEEAFMEEGPTELAPVEEIAVDEAETTPEPAPAADPASEWPEAPAEEPASEWSEAPAEEPPSCIEESPPADMAPTGSNFGDVSDEAAAGEPVPDEIEVKEIPRISKKGKKGRKSRVREKGRVKEATDPEYSSSAIVESVPFYEEPAGEPASAPVKESEGVAPPPAPSPPPEFPPEDYPVDPEPETVQEESTYAPPEEKSVEPEPAVGEPGSAKAGEVPAPGGYPPDGWDSWGRFGGYGNKKLSQ